MTEVDKYNPFGYTPNLAANIVGCVIFGIILVAQLGFGLYTQDWWMFVSWGIASGLEFAGYVARAISHHYEWSEPMYEMQLVCLILGPAFMAAGLYYQLAKEITIFGRKYSVLKPMIYNAIFTTCDVISLVVQAAGGGDAAANVRTAKGPRTGGWIMVAGIAFQVLVLLVFIIMFAWVNYHIMTDTPANWDPKFETNRHRVLFKFWIPSVCVSLLFLLIRSAYRIAELSEGWTGHLMRTERYFLILDGLMIIIGMTPLCIIYPAIAYGYVPIEGLHYKQESSSSRESKDSVDEKAALHESGDTPSLF